jgi:hypothetical protein
MFLRVKCPNGHALKVPTKFAGREGVCPICKSKVKIPPLQKPEVSEDAILDVISTGPAASTVSRYAASRNDLPTNDEESALQEPESTEMEVRESGEDSSLLKIRKCPQCQRKVPPHFHVCPNCKTYLMEDSVVAQEKATATCPTCGARSYPGAEFCEQCGEKLFLRE